MYKYLESVHTYFFYWGVKVHYTIWSTYTYVMYGPSD